MQSPLCEVHRLSEPSARSPWRLAGEASLVSGSATAAVLISHAGIAPAFLSHDEASSALAVLAGSLALATAAMWHVVRRLTGDGRAALCAGAMAVYGLVAVPSLTLGSVVDARGAMGVVRLAAHLVVVVFLLGCSMPSMARSRAGSRKLLGAGLLVVLGAGIAGFADPPHALAVSQIPALRWLVIAGWLFAGLRVTYVAVQLGLKQSVRVGLGLTLLAVAHGYRVATEAAQPLGGTSLTFAMLRLVALVFIGLGALRFGGRALQGLGEEHRLRESSAGSLARLVPDDEPEATPLTGGRSRWTARRADLSLPTAWRIPALVARPRRSSAGVLTGLLPLASALGLLVAAYAVCRIPAVSGWLSLKEVGVSLALVAVTAGVVSAFSCAVLGQLVDEPAGLWLGAGLAFYSVIGIPAATFTADWSDSQAAVGNLRMLAHAMLVVLALAAVFVAARPRRDGWVVLGIGSALAVGAAVLGVAFPAESLALTTNDGLRYGLCASWLISGVLLLVSGYVRRWPWQCCAGVGCTVIAIAHTQRVASGSPMIPLGPTFPTVRLLGVLLLAAGVLPAARRALIETYTTRHEQLAELHRALADIQRSKERDHDMRSGLAGLTNAHALLESGVRAWGSQDDLRAAVTTELKRLTLLLQPAQTDQHEHLPHDYEVLPIVQARVALQTAVCSDIRLDVEPDLRATGNPLILSQVLANVLTNCERHAPGSPLRIQAMRHDDTVVLRVCDFGPGIPAELAGSVFDLAVRGPASTGQGFGLHICRRLLEGESGRIYLRPRPATGSGCTVVIDLPAAAGDGSGYPDLADASAR